MGPLNERKLPLETSHFATKNHDDGRILVNPCKSWDFNYPNLNWRVCRISPNCGNARTRHPNGPSEGVDLELVVGAGNRVANGVSSQLSTISPVFFVWIWMFPKIGVPQNAVHTKSVSRPRGCRRQNAKTGKRENWRTEPVIPWKHANAKTRKSENAKTGKRENTKTRKHENAKSGKLSMCPEALWTRTLSQVWTCLKYVPKQSIP